MGFPFPSIGRIVHYVSHGTPVRPDGTQAYPPECRAAIVTEVALGRDRAWLGLDVRNPTGGFFHPLSAGGCMQDERPKAEREGGTWHWPERETEGAPPEGGARAQ